MGKEFQKKYMHPTRRKLVDMVQTGEYDKNTTIGYTKADKKRNVGDIWEDTHHKYEKKEGYILKTGKNSDALQEIREYLEEKSKCKNSECKTIKKSDKDRKLIEKNGYCLNCTVETEHKVWTKMIIFGTAKIEEYKQSLLDVKPYYEYINEDGSTEKWELPQPVEEVKKEIQELIDFGTKELDEIKENRIKAFEILRENNLLDDRIKSLHSELELIDSDIDRVQNNIYTIRRNTDEQVNSVDAFNISELQEFFAKRYDSIFKAANSKVSN